MPLINLVIILVVVGVILWLINNYIPMDRKIKSILNIVVVIVVIIWLLSVFGVIGSLSGIRVGRVRFTPIRQEIRRLWPGLISSLSEPFAKLGRS